MDLAPASPPVALPLGVWLGAGVALRGSLSRNGRQALGGEAY